MSDHDELTTQLTRSLTTQSDAMAGSSLGLADVQGRARSIRRRRTATAVAGVAMAVAVVVPSISLLDHTGGTTEPAPATQSPTPTTPTATPTDVHAPLDVRGLALGAPPADGYLVDGTIHLGDGGTAQVNGVHGTVDALALLSDGTAVYHSRDSRGRASVEVTDAGGTDHGPYPAGDGLATDAARGAAAWVAPDGQVRLWVATGTSPRSLGSPVPGAGPQVDALAGDCSAGSPCRVLVRTTDQSTGEVSDWLVSDAGTTKVAPGHRLLTVNDVSAGGQLLGYTTIGDGSSCSAVDDGGSRLAWRTCAHTLLAFSPDGDHVSADVAFHSGDGSSEIAAYDATGQLVFEHRATAKTQATVQSTVWEDDDHLLAVVRQGLEWSVVRFGTDGSMELAVAPTTGTDNFRSPIVLSGGRG